MTDRCGRTRMLQCKYHGWTYTLEGSLRGVPRFNRVDLFDKSEFGLREIETQIWQGLIFVRICLEGIPLNDSLTGIPERIAPLRLDGMNFYKQVRYESSATTTIRICPYAANAGTARIRATRSPPASSLWPATG